MVHRNRANAIPSRRTTSAPRSVRHDADELSPISGIEDALIEGGAPDLSEDLARPDPQGGGDLPLPHGQLDLRENTMRLTKPACERCGGRRRGATVARRPGQIGQVENWIVAELARPLPSNARGRTCRPRRWRRLACLSSPATKAMNSIAKPSAAILRA